jgi:hypothetical protein
MALGGADAICVHEEEERGLISLSHLCSQPRFETIASESFKSKIHFVLHFPLAHWFEQETYVKSTH